MAAYLGTALTYQELAVAEERRVAEWLSEDVGDHRMSIQVRHDDDALLLLLTHVVVRKRDVLGSSAMHRVVGHGDRASAIAVQVDGLDELVEVKLFEKIVQPARLAHSLGRCAILAVVSRSSHGRKELGVPGDDAAAVVEAVGARRLVGVHAVGVRRVVHPVDL